MKRCCGKALKLEGPGCISYHVITHSTTLLESSFPSTFALKSLHYLVLNQCLIINQLCYIINIPNSISSQIISKIIMLNYLKGWHSYICFELKIKLTRSEVCIYIYIYVLKYLSTI